MRIAVFGAGGIGGYFGARLAQAGDDVALIARGPHLEAIQTNGLFVESPTGDFHITPSIATDNPQDVGAVDIIILGVKAWDVKAAAGAIRPMLGPDTGVMTLQNGVEAPTEVAAAIGEDHTIIGVTPVRCSITAPGRLRCLIGLDPNLRLGEMDNRKSERVEHVRSALTGVDVTVDVPDDIHASLWGKFIAVSAMGYGAVLRVPIGVWREVPQVRDMVERVARESMAVAEARGVHLPDGLIDIVKGAVDALPPEYMASMHQDMVAGRPTELEYWNGSVVRLGKEAGVPTPLNDFIYYSLLPQEMKARGQL